MENLRSPEEVTSDFLQELFCQRRNGEQCSPLHAEASEGERGEHCSPLHAEADETDVANNVRRYN